MWTGNNYHGVSPLALQRLWNRFGYVLVNCTDLIQVIVDAESAVTHHQVKHVQSCLSLFVSAQRFIHLKTRQSLT
jgi:hypothetical protein